MKSQNCPACGAPLLDENCEYCGDLHIQQRPQDALKNFLIRLDQKCDEVPNSLNGKIILIWLGIPALVAAAAYMFAFSTLEWVLWGMGIILSVVLSTIIAGTMRNNYLKEKYQYILAPVLKKYLRTQQVTSEEAYRTAKKVLPKGSALLRHMTIHTKSPKAD